MTDTPDVNHGDDAIDATIDAAVADDAIGDSEFGDTNADGPDFSELLRSIGTAIANRSRASASNGAGPGWADMAKTALSVASTLAAKQAATPRRRARRDDTPLSALLGYLDDHDVEYTLRTSNPSSTDDQIIIPIHRMAAR